MKRNHLFEKDGLSAGDISDGLPWHGVGEKADKIAGMARFKSDANFAIGLKAAYARPMSGSRIDYDEGAPAGIYLYPFGRHDSHETIVDRSIESPAIGYYFSGKIENVGRSFGNGLAILITTLPHRIPEEHLPLSGVHEVSKGRV
jgi:hypothetical protein